MENGDHGNPPTGRPQCTSNIVDPFANQQNGEKQCSRKPEQEDRGSNFASGTFHHVGILKNI
jgi:hypothetical protein